MRAKLIASLLGLALLTGCSSAPDLTEVPDVTSMAGDEAQDAIEEAGFEIEFDAGDDSVWMASNWTVMSQDPAAGSKAEDGALVTLVVGKPAAEETEPEPEEEVVPAPAPAPVVEATSMGLTGSTAQDTCDLAGEIQFPYGYDPHWFVGLITAEIVNDQWFFKVETSVTNEYDAERDVVIECTVSGSEDVPALASYIFY